MAEKRRFLDIWIVETNTVYKEVPFAVVTDWVQQGRLLEDDMWKPSGTKDWQRLGGSAELQPYFPRPEPDRPQDQAEALESVHMDFTYKRPHEDEDDEVDMIPLIDVSLVLLVFFMLTATSAGLAAFVRPPESRWGEIGDQRSLRIDVSRDEDGEVVYAIGVGNNAPEREERNLRTLAAALDRLRVRVNKADGDVEVVINADRDLPWEVTHAVSIGLQADPFRSKVQARFFGTSQKEEP